MNGKKNSCPQTAMVRIAGSLAFVLGITVLYAGDAVNQDQSPIHPEVTFVGEPCGGGSLLYGNDILVTDTEPTEYYCDMVSSSSGEYFLVVENFPPSTSVDIFRSSDGGSSWWHYANLVGSSDDITTPALAIPELDEDYLYLIYEYLGQIQVARFDLSSNVLDYYNVEYNTQGVYNPRITTDNIDYPGNYWLYVSYTSFDGSNYNVKVARSEDDAANWVANQTLQVQGSFIPTPDIAFGNYNLYMVADSLHWSGEWEVRMSRSTNLGTTWEAPQNLTDVTSVSCIYPRVGAIQSGNEVVVAYEQYDVGVDEDIYYAYSSDGGMNWNKHYCLACTSQNNEGWPDVTVDPILGDFHLTFRKYDGVSTFNTMYSHAPRTNPTGWSTPEVVDDVGTAYNDWPRPVAVDWTTLEAGVAWPDWRTTTQAVFFDRVDFEPTFPLQIAIYPVNGLIFQPGDYIFYGVFLTNHSSSAIQVTAAVYGSNQSNWHWNLFGPLNFTIPGDTTYGPIIRNDQVPWAAPPMSAYLCAEANAVHDCFQVTIE